MNNLIKRFIYWYLRRVGGAFHQNEYGPQGVYITALKDWEYYIYKNMVKGKSIAEFAATLKTAKDYELTDSNSNTEE